MRIFFINFREFIVSLSRRIFAERKLVIISDTYIKTIKFCKTTQLVIITSFISFILIIITMILVSAKFYSKVDKKQRKIDQMSQDQVLAKSEIAKMIDTLDQINTYYAVTKKKTSVMSINKESDMKDEFLDEEGTSEEFDSNDKKKIKFLFDELKLMEYEKKDLHELMSLLRDGILSWYKYAIGRYQYIRELLQSLNLLNCSDVSMFNKFLSAAGDITHMLNRFSNNNMKYSEQDLINKIKIRVCSSSYINLVNKIYLANDGVIDKLISDKMFIPSLIKLEKILNELPIGDPIYVPHRLSSRFGVRFHPILRVRKVHEGIDLTAPYGTAIHSTASGYVVRSGYYGSYGLTIDIQHKNGILTRYAHLSSTNVRVGQKVSVGTNLGKEGSSGRSSGPHLHYEIRINNLAINPIRFLSLIR